MTIRLHKRTRSYFVPSTPYSHQSRSVRLRFFGLPKTHEIKLKDRGLLPKKAGIFLEIDPYGRASVNLPAAVVLGNGITFLSGHNVMQLTRKDLRLAPIPNFTIVERKLPFVTGDSFPRSPLRSKSSVASVEAEIGIRPAMQYTSRYLRRPARSTWRCALD